MSCLTKRIRKFDVGGIANLADPQVPKAEVEIYLRSAEGETFHVSSLHEGMLHLLSTEGYRLGISEWPDGAGFGNEHYGVTIRREGDELSVELTAPMIDSLETNSRLLAGESAVCWDFRPRPSPREVAAHITVVPIPVDVLEGAEETSEDDSLAVPPAFTEVEVTIDGT